MIKLDDVLVFLALLAVAYIAMFEQDLIMSVLTRVIE